ncbi:MAG: hypothetical protein GDA44_03685, partial [Prochloron sp. SP5CPC1]|nr:hypothetical protein [Candidatus Paraprochloron terpiosi SP5CPC1]
QLRNNDDIIPDNELRIDKIIFEIQIQSAFEHAWLVSTHDIVYKSSDIDWRKFRLAAQIKATVEQLDMLILAFEQNSEFIQNNDYREIKIKRFLASEINKLFENNKIPDELKPKDMSRFCDNLYRLLNQVADEKEIKNIIKKIIKKVQATPSNKITRSISLFQYFVVILISEQMIKPSLDKYYWHITEEVTTLYPALQTISCIFRYNEDD